MTDVDSRPISPWSPGHRRTTIGIFALTFAYAFESLAVSTVMPDVAEALDGIRWYATSFAAPLAVSVVSFTVTGSWIDRRGSSSAVTTGCATFIVGLVVAGAAQSMEVFLVGRVLQGLGGGVILVAVFVIVAESYPPASRAAAFRVLALAWTLPSLVGPLAAASLAELAGWRTVFLVVPTFVVAAWILVRNRTSDEPGAPTKVPAPVGRSVLAAVSVLVVSFGGQRDIDLWPIVLGAGVVGVVVAGPRLLPAGTWRGGRGLPSILATRGLLSAAFYGAQAYVPLLLATHRDVSITAAGWVLSGGAVGWCAGSWASGRLRMLPDPLQRLRVGAMVSVAGFVGFTVLTLVDLPLVLAATGWAVCGLGLGLAYTTSAVVVLNSTPTGETGRTSAAIQLNDALTQALVLALGSLMFATWAGVSVTTGAVVVVATSAGFAMLAIATSVRAGLR